MKTLLLSLLLTLCALLLIASSVGAQSRESDRDWIDSLAVKYRTAFIESALLRDQAALDSMGAGFDELIHHLRNSPVSERGTNDELVEAIREYGDEKEIMEIRMCAYRQEMLSMRTDFSPL